MSDKQPLIGAQAPPPYAPQSTAPREPLSLSSCIILPFAAGAAAYPPPQAPPPAYSHPQQQPPAPPVYGTTTHNITVCPLSFSLHRETMCVYVGGAGKAHSNQEGDRDKTTELHPPICGGTLCLLLGLWPHCPPLRTPGECFITMATGKPPSPTGGFCLGSWEQAECQEPLCLRSELEYRWNDCWLWTVHWNTRVFCCLVSSWDLAKNPFHNHNHVCVNCFENCL